MAFIFPGNPRGRLPIAVGFNYPPFIFPLPCQSKAITWAVNKKVIDLGAISIKPKHILLVASGKSNLNNNREKATFRVCVFFV